MTETVIIVVIVVAAAYVALRPMVRALRGKGSGCACDAMCSEALRRKCAHDPSRCPLATFDEVSHPGREKDESVPR